MCLSTVYKISKDEKPELICKDIAAIINSSDGILTFSDIMGITLQFKGRIDRVDLMDNFVYVVEE